MKPIIVQKYGGSSVATVEKLQSVADLILARKREGYDLVVVVSAMGDTTDELLAKAKAVSPSPDRRELDMLLTVGERISMSLLAMAIRERGENAVSLTGSQSGIITTASHTSARIMEVRPFRIQDELESGRVVIVAGYQGVSYRREITTLGRGGSDTTAVALAAALDAEACEIYSDVDGVFTADPRVVPTARALDGIRYEEMQEMAGAGAKVLNAAAVEFAKSAHIALYARRTGSTKPGTVVRRDVPEPPSGVRGVAHETQVVFVEGDVSSQASLRGWIDELSRLGVAPKSTSWIGARFRCVLGVDDLHNADTLRAAAEASFGAGAYRDDHGAVSLIGPSVTEDPARLSTVFDALDGAGIAVDGVSTSRFRLTVFPRSADVAATARLLHDTFGLEHRSAEAIIA